MIIKKLGRKCKSILRSMYARSNPFSTGSFTKDELLFYLRKFDVISFDIFNTLLTRSFYHPDDLFLLMSSLLGDKDFLEKRKRAEQEARTIYKKDVNLSEIYACFCPNSKYSAEEAKKLECNLELEYCLPRSEMLSVFNSLVKEKKAVILTSDMYLDKKTIQKMLSKCGYKNYTRLFLSNDINKRKDTGEVWPDIKRLFPHKKIVHLGDNIISDVRNPRLNGIKTVYIKSGISIAKEYHIDSYLGSPLCAEDSVFVGKLLNGTLFNSPFHETVGISTLDSLGFCFHGPVLERFLSLIMEKASEDDILLFLAREGYYLQKYYRYYSKKQKRPLLPNHYLLASRNALSLANLNSLSDIYRLLKNDYSGSLQSWLQQILHLDIGRIEDNCEITLPRDADKVKPVIKKYYKQVVSSSADKKLNYVSYFNRITKGYTNKQIKIVDLGYSGTIQYELSRLFGTDFSGIYLASSNNVKRYSRGSSLRFLFNTSLNANFIKIYHYSLILEYLLSAPYGQFLWFSKEKSSLVPKYNSEVLTEEKQATISKISDGVLSYLDFCTHFTHLKKLNPSKEIVFSLYCFIIEQNMISRQVKDKFDFMDAFTKDSSQNVFKIIGRY